MIAKKLQIAWKGFEIVIEGQRFKQKYTRRQKAATSKSKRFGERTYKLAQGGQI